MPCSLHRTERRHSDVEIMRCCSSKCRRDSGPSLDAAAKEAATDVAT